MVKSKPQSLGTVVVGGLVFYAAIWLYQQFGWIAVAGLVGAFAAACAGKLILSRRRQAESFDKLVRYLLVKRMSSQQAAQLNAAMSQNSPARVALIGKVRELHDQMETALASKQRATAQESMQSVRDLHTEIQQDYAKLLSAQLMTEMADVIRKHEQVFNSRLDANVAEGLLEKADRVEDAQTSMQYAALALKTIDEGLENPKSEKQALQAMRKKVEKRLEPSGPGSEPAPVQHG